MQLATLSCSWPCMAGSRWTVPSPRTPSSWSCILYVPVGSQRCSCELRSGELRPTLPSAVFRKQLVVFRNIAGFHGFELLEQLSDWLLGQHPGEVPGMAQAAEV